MLFFDTLKYGWIFLGVNIFLLVNIVFTKNNTIIDNAIQFMGDVWGTKL